ncbi:hypothetical protein [Opitutus terrae]|uniref:Uncharacterized protein n=1 Tax=Opitutus terrae (strain DSM 11246 / JCM 15787 / PB90-1) TaxID=452637 RepID=B1ZZW6_OPITP|nr:hypothetical protein [Opitutus terrae]ACB77299.1 hypothetical protein Oter_4025 [Opitutus terrae PB90-1]
MAHDTLTSGARCPQRVVKVATALGTMRCAALLIACVALLASASAAPLESDLGEGLRYYRATELPTDLPPPPTGKPTPLVFDLRFTIADETAATALEAWLKFRATAAAPVLVLVNHETAPVLRPVLAAQKSNPGLLTIGATEPEFTPDVTVAVKSDVERRAYDAAQNGTPVAALAAPPIDKPRSDEAALIRDRASLPEDDSDAGVDELGLSDEPPPTHGAQPAPPPVDLALQRAVQIHRGLRALKRL